MDFITPLPDDAFEESRLDRLVDSIRERSERFDAMLDAQPQALPCPIHGAQLMSVNREASRRAAKAVYTCPSCEHDQFVQRCFARIEAAGIPADVRHATLGNFTTERPEVKTEKGFHHPVKFLETAQAFATEAMRNVFFAGTPGIGKGHLAAALAMMEIVKGRRVRWVECAKLFSEYHRAYKSDDTDRVIANYATDSLLVLDEVCLRDLPADGEEILFAILDARHKAGRRTIILGNKPAKETREWLGSRITDRLRSGGVSFCYGEWKSMRGGEQDGAQEEF